MQRLLGYLIPLVIPLLVLWHRIRCGCGYHTWGPVEEVSLCQERIDARYCRYCPLGETNLFGVTVRIDPTKGNGTP